MVRRAMNPGGLMVTQSASPYFTREVFWAIRDTLRAAGMDTFSYHVTVPAFSIWGFNLAAATTSAPTDFDITVPTRFLNNEAMRRAAVFEPDQAPMPVAVNTVFEPTLYQLYLLGVSRW